MIEKLSEEEKKLFLQEFTKELVKAAFPVDIYKLERILASKERPREKIIFEKKEAIKNLVKIEKEEALEIRRERFLRSPPIRRMNFGEPLFLRRMGELRPFPTMKKIDVGKIRMLLDDPKVKEVIYHGAHQKIKVRGFMGERNTNINLSQDEANQLLQNFSRNSKIPLQEGIFRAAVGRLIMVAQVKGNSAEQLSIKKLEVQPYNPAQRTR